MSDTKPQSQEAQRKPNRINAPPNRTSSYFKKNFFNQDKKKILEGARMGGKHLTYREAKIRTKSDFSSESM